MRTPSQRIEVEFSPAPADCTLIAVTNHDLPPLEDTQEDLHDAVVRHGVLSFVDDPHERRGMIEPALHD